MQTMLFFAQQIYRYHILNIARAQLFMVAADHGVPLYSIMRPAKILENLQTKQATVRIRNAVTVGEYCVASQQ